jgi:hypothetical protein
VSDPRRLSSAADEEVRELLRHGRVGAPPGFKARALDVALQTLAAPAAVAVPGGVAGKGIGAGASKVALLANVHWVGIACVVGVCTAGGVVLTRTASEAPKSSAAVRLVPAAKERVAPPAGSDWSPVAVDLMSLPAVPPATSALLPAPPSSLPIQLAPLSSAQVDPPVSTPDGDESADLNLSPELVPLDLARRAIANREAPRALDILDDYGTRFPGGALRSEATMLRIEALVAVGRRPDATRLGAAVLASAPDSPYAARVRSLIGSAMK